jgi:predicted RNA-binding Zn-ribbon protein involved in translation (DUF1610 family)
VTIHIEPSWFVRNVRRYKTWCSITVCEDCGLRAKYEDCHPVHPCPNCGSRMVEHVGRWQATVKKVLFGLLKRERGGRWVLLEEEKGKK